MLMTAICRRAGVEWLMALSQQSLSLEEQLTSLQLTLRSLCSVIAHVFDSVCLNTTEMPKFYIWTHLFIFEKQARLLCH